MYLKMHRDNQFNYTETCFMCGAEFGLGQFTFEVWDAADPLGFLCYECLELDPSAQADRLCEHAARLRQHATWLEEIAAEGFPQLRRADAQVYAAWQQERDLPRIAADDLPF
jgi:hypothetical protein